MKKICSKCEIEKDIEDFRKQRNMCKKCEKEKSLEYYYANKESRKEYSREYHKNSDVYKKSKKKWRKNNLEKIKKQDKERHEKNYKENKEELCERVRNYRKNNLDKVRELEKKKRSTEKYRKYRKQYLVEYKKQNEHIYAWRTVLRNTITRLGIKKEDKTINMLGYSALDLKIHIESLFTPGMTWENHGEWHIDHIKPVSSFDKDTPASVVNALSNLQPLWSTTRIIDGVIYEGNLNKGKS